MKENHYNNIVDKNENTHLIKIIKEEHYTELIEALSLPTTNIYLKNIFGQSSLDFLNKINKKYISKVAELVNCKNAFLNLNYSEKDKFLIAFHRNKTLHSFLKIKDKYVIQKIYHSTIDLKTNKIKNPFLINKIIFAKKVYPSISDKEILNLISKDKTSFFYCSTSNAHLLSLFLNKETFISLIRKMKTKEDSILLKTTIDNFLTRKDLCLQYKFKVKTVKELRSLISINLIIKNNQKYNHLIKYMNLNNTYIYDNYQILIPYDNKNFLFLSYKLKNCLNDILYFEDFIKNKRKILYIKKNNILYCVELDQNDKIIIVLKKYNKVPTIEEKISIQSIIDLLFT